MDEVIKILTEKNKTIATMESCTGGGIANALTNISGASLVFKFGAITYANEFKIKMGIKEETITKYTVYSFEVAREMSKQIALYAAANYGIGITGKLNSADPFNPSGDDSLVFISIFDRDKDQFFDFSLTIKDQHRQANKDYIIGKIVKKLLDII